MNMWRDGSRVGHEAASAESTPAELELRSRNLRTDIDMTLSEIAGRLAPDHLRRIAGARVRRSSIGLALMAVRAVQHRPRTAAAAAGFTALAAAGALIRYWRRRKGH